MKLYGIDDTGVARGEIIAATVPGADVDNYGLDIVCKELGWEFASTTFKGIKRELIARMVADDADPELVRGVQYCKAADVPVVEVLD